MKSKHVVILTALLLMTRLTLSAQERMDSLFFRNGDIEVVTISKNSTDVIECYYPGEDMVSVVEKNQLNKIVFKSGRTEFCNKRFLNSEQSANEGRWTKGLSSAIEFFTIPTDYHLGTCAISGLVGYRYRNVFLGGGIKWQRFVLRTYDLEPNEERRWAYYDGLTYFTALKVNFNNRRLSPYIKADYGVENKSEDRYGDIELGFDIKLGEKQKRAIIIKAGVSNQTIDYIDDYFNSITDSYIYMGLGFRF